MVKIQYGISTIVLTLYLIVSSNMFLVPVNAQDAGFTEWELPDGAGPLEIITDRLTNKIWYACANARIGRIDPPTNTFTEWFLYNEDDGAQTADYLIVFEDTIYFTDYARNKIGKLLSNTDQVSTETVPTDSSTPAGITFPHFFIDAPPSVTFIEKDADKMGRLQLDDSTFTHLFPAPRSNATVSPSFNTVEPEVTVATPTVTPGDPHLPPPIVASPPMVSGPFTEWNLLEGMPSNIVADGMGFWYSTADDYIGRLMSGDSIHIYTLPTEWTVVTHVTVDSEGNVWYTATVGADPSQGIIGKLEPESLTVTEWIVPTPDGRPICLVIDGSGMVWFSEFDGNKIGKLDPTSNTFSEYLVPTPDSNPWRLAIDVDGNIWFNEWSAGKVGVLSPTGEMISTLTSTTATTETSEPTESASTLTETSTTETSETTATTTAPSPPVPGFSSVSILAGLLVASTMLIITRKKAANT